MKAIGCARKNIHQHSTRRVIYSNFIHNIYPESINTKIIDDSGNLAILERFYSLFKQLPYGTEIIILGGNPLLHPGLTNFLDMLRRSGKINSINLHQDYIDNDTIDILKKLQDCGNIYNINIYCSSTVEPEYYDIERVTYCVDIGKSPISILDSLKEESVLVLGCKGVNKNLNNCSEHTTRNIKNWYKNIYKYLLMDSINFDNLALEQLNMQRLLPEDIWNDYYIGNDNQFSMYVDLVEGKYSASDTSSIRFPIEQSMCNMFSKIRGEIA